MSHFPSSVANLHVFIDRTLEDVRQYVFMSVDPGILCFKHCHSASVFCRKLPEICPLCREDLSGSSLLPFRIPYPFVRANQKPCTILIKPSNGAFLDYYSINNSDLHIGITTSRGVVVEYDVSGVSKTKTDTWNECLIVYELAEAAWSARWDTVLLRTANEFSSIRYNENIHNCYTFVLAFVQCFEFSDLKSSSATKEKFCERWIAPPLKDACRYISLFRELRKTGVFVQENIQTSKVTL